jgi:hypothetical protein
MLSKSRQLRQLDDGMVVGHCELRRSQRRGGGNNKIKIIKISESVEKRRSTNVFRAQNGRVRAVSGQFSPEKKKKPRKTVRMTQRLEADSSGLFEFEFLDLRFFFSFVPSRSNSMEHLLQLAIAH